MMWYYGSGDMGWGWMAFGMLWMLVFWVAIVSAIVWAVRVAARREEVSVPTTSPLDIAKARYARGEITKAEYEGIRRDLIA